ncbi:hypothetical protein [Sagittula salina]|uniref:Uncharacterized protein n=1 Tax=Sagittula salina TaxID=2820268 RepID=A0A940S2M6_9RHOB|nr:hypothetical protein [Sagittula salina]MBP0481835.1 hypothetical protein [Sagittula salina]
MATPLEAVQTALAWFQNNVPVGTLARTTYGALAYSTGNNQKVLLIATAGAGANGITGTMIDALQTHLNGNNAGDHAVAGCANTMAPPGVWHMNDAERQLMRTAELAVQEGSSLAPAGALGAIGATRVFCGSCQHFVLPHFTHTAHNRLAWN